MEFFRDNRGSVSSALLTFVLLALARWAAGLGLEVCQSLSFGSDRGAPALVLRFLGIRCMGAVPTGLFLAAACAPFYAIRHVPMAFLTTQGNLLAASAMAFPSLLMALLAMALERAARAHSATSEDSIWAAWGLAATELRGGLSPMVRRFTMAILAGFVLGATATYVSHWRYGIGIVLAQTMLFVAAYLRARAFARALQDTAM